MSDIVASLEWRLPCKATNYCWAAKTPFGEYSLAFDDGWHAEFDPRSSCWEWESELDPRSYDGPQAAMDGCQAHFTNLVVSSLAVNHSAELTRLRAENEKLRNQDQCDASERFARWLNEGPALANAAGCFVGITVREAKDGKQ